MITATHLSHNFNATGVSSLATGSVAPGKNKLVIVSVASFDAGGNPNTPSSVAGAGLTFDLISSQRKSVVNTNLRVSLYRAMSASPSTGGITVTFPSGTGRIFISADQFDGINTSGVNGVNAVVQSAFNQIDGVNTGLTATLAALANNNNAAFGFVYQDGNQAITKGANFSELTNNNNSGIVEAEYAQRQQTAVNWTWGSANVGAIALALEIRAALAGGGIPLL